MLHTHNISFASGFRPRKLSTYNRRDRLRVLAQVQHYDVAVVGAGPAGGVGQAAAPTCCCQQLAELLSFVRKQYMNHSTLMWAEP
jgi:hypothetical protein